MKRSINSRFNQLFSCHDAEGTDLVRRLLHLQPSRRLSASAGLRHAYVRRFRGANAGAPRVKATTVVPPFDDNVQLSVDEYRQKLYELIEATKTAQKQQRKQEQQQQEKA